jgi:hypothetical protein
MPLSILYWILMLLWLVFGLWSGYIPGQAYSYRVLGGSILQFILFAVIGWKLFGPPIQ